MKESMSMKIMKLIFRIRHFKHALIHLAHGLFPSISLFEKLVETQDLDHVDSLTQKTKAKDFWSHLLLNLKCMVRHLILGLFQFIVEVNFKEVNSNEHN